MMSKGLDLKTELQDSIQRLQELYVGKKYVFRKRTDDEVVYAVTKKDIKRSEKTIACLQSRLDALEDALGLLQVEGELN